MDKAIHKQQQKIWEEEHKNPHILLQMNDEDPSGGVVAFFDFLKEQKLTNLTGIEMGCGKGRNVIYLASQKENNKVFGFDFSPTAIKVAQKRSKKVDISRKVKFTINDATLNWPFNSNSIDYVIDNFVSADIESLEGRKFAIMETKRVLKSKGFLMVYALTPYDEFHKEMIKENPAKEDNSFYYSNGKFEKTFLMEELKNIYKDFKIIKFKKVSKNTYFFGKKYPCYHYWMIFQKI